MSIPSPEKPLDRMDRLADMAYFPALVNAGATANILLTLTAVFFLIRYLRVSSLSVYLPDSLITTPLLITLLILILNLAPVVVLRAIGWQRSAPIPALGRMNFFHDQHRFSDWVYLAASANMAFWVLLGWSVFFFFPTVTALLATLAVAFLVTFSPVLLRRRSNRTA